MARLLSACNAVSYFIFAGVAVLFVERLGRRSLMMISTFLQLVAFLCISVLLKYAIANGSTECAKAPSSFSSSTISRLQWVCLEYLGSIRLVSCERISASNVKADQTSAEINSLPMRTKGAAVATATNWITNFVIVEITPIGFQNLGWRFWPIWVGTNALFLPIIYSVIQKPVLEP